MRSAREDLELLLPFHANGTLTPQEQARVEAWLAEDPDAAADAAGLAAIRLGMQAEDVRSPGEFGLARLLRDVRQDQPGAASAPPRSTWRQPLLWQAVAALAVAALLGQALWPGQNAEPRFEMAGADEGPALVVGFSASATEGQIRMLLNALGLEIVSGPSAVGLYRLHSIDGADTTQTVPALEAATDIVETVAHDDE